MTSLATPEDKADLHSIAPPPRANRILVVLVVILALALLGLGAWLIFGQTSESEFAPSAEIQQVVDDYFNLANAYDVEGMTELMTDDYMIYFGSAPWSGSSSLSGETTKAEYLAGLGSWMPTFEFVYERLGEPQVIGDGPWNVSQGWRLTEGVEPLAGDPYIVEGVSILTIVEEDGVLKVGRDVQVQQFP